MPKAETRHKSDVLFWADIHPKKRGSFEDYIYALNTACREKNITIRFVFLNHIADSVKCMLNEIKYHVLRDKESHSIKALIHVLQKTNPKIIHYNFSPACSSRILISRFMGVKKQIFMEHSSDSIYKRSKAGVVLEPLKRLRRKLYNWNIDKFVGVSDYVINRARTVQRVPESKICVIYNGVNLERFHPSTEQRDLFRKQFLNGARQKYIVSYVGQLIPEKGIFVFLDAAHELLKKRSDVLFLIAGEGAHREIAQTSVHKSAPPNIHFLGMRDDVEAILNASDIFVCPSIWQEAFGLAVAEAMACGVPVVASKTGGIPEVVKDRETGILVPPNNHRALVKAVSELLENKEMRNSCGEAGRKRAVENFSLDEMASKTVRLYEEALSLPDTLPRSTNFLLRKEKMIFIRNIACLTASLTKKMFF